MLVYGDRAWRQGPRAVIEHLREGLARLEASPAGIERHAALVALFIEAGELAQGVGDAAFGAAGCDTRSPAQDAAMAVTTALARAVVASWRDLNRDTPPPQPAPADLDIAAALDRLAATDLPGEILVKEAEGYAFYALYPEAYAEAAAALAPAPQTRVIGLRSIGTGLAAMVVAALGAADPVSVRPSGHPFARRLELSPALRAELAAPPRTRFAVVDEGPGLSGSSFGAVADLLEDQGVAPESIAFFPGHHGAVGPQASERHRRRWAAAERRTVGFDALVGPERLAGWAEDLIGPAIAPVRDLSGGAWRALAAGDEAGWPASDTVQERRKVLVVTRSGSWLLKFCSLGRRGGQALERAQALCKAGFIAEVAGLRHGFLVQRWLEAARPLGLVGFDRRRLVAGLGRYLGFRAGRMPAAPDAGAGPAALLEMARVNTAEALGDEAAARLAPWAARVEALGGALRRVDTDNRLHKAEWLVADGRLVKTDALDHAHAHDLIGAQDIAWDLAGAAVELDLTPPEQARLRTLVAAQTGHRPDRELLAFYRPCYLAFQLGAYSMAADAHAGWPAEQARLAAMRDGYAGRLRATLTSLGPGGSGLAGLGLAGLGRAALGEGET